MADPRQDHEAILRRVDKLQLGLQRLRELGPAIRSLVESPQRRKALALRPKIVDDRPVG